MRDPRVYCIRFILFNQQGMKRTSAFLTLSLAAATLITSVAPAFAESNASSRKELKTKTPVDNICVQTAITTRETKIDGGWSVYSSALSTAYLTRKSSLYSAWSQTNVDDRKTAVNNAWSSFKTAKKTAAQTWKSVRDTAWKQFKNDSKKCGSDATTATEMGNSNSDL